MKRFLLGSILVACFAASASATISYSFTTVGSYTGSGTVDTTTTVNSCNVTGDLCVDFSTGTDASSDLAVQLFYNTFGDATGNATQAETFGTVEIFCISTAANGGLGALSTGCGNETLSGDLTVTVNQTNPDVESKAFVDVISGTSQGGYTAAFGTSSFTTDSGDLTYALSPATVTGGHIQSGTNSEDGSNTLDGSVTANASTPEPATFALMGAGLLGLGWFARKRRA
jgi:hypothetical protein